MRTKHLKTILTTLAMAGLGWSASTATAQDTPSVNTAPPAAFSAPAPQLAYGVPQVLQLAQAKVSDETIIAFIKNSGNSYGLNVDQIIYLRQQGISDAVVTTMLNQPRPAVAAATSVQPAASTPSAQPAPTVTVAPAVTYVQTVPATTYYYSQPYYYPTYSYDYYPPISFSFGWRGGWGVWGVGAAAMVAAGGMAAGMVAGIAERCSCISSARQ